MSRTLFGARLSFCALTFCSFALFASSAHATLLGNLGPAFNYNVFLFGDDNQVGSDFQGALAVGGNANFTATSSGGPTIGTALSSSTVNFVVGGNLNHMNNTLNGGLLVNGSVNWASPSISGSVNVNNGATFTGGGTVAGPIDVVGPYSAPSYYPPNASPPTVTPLPFDFNVVKSNLLTNSNGWAALTPTGTPTVSGSTMTLTATGPSSNLFVFDVSGSVLSTINTFNINAPSGSTVLVNIDGTTDSMQGGLNLTGVDSQHVLYNFSSATSLTLNNIAVLGTLVAPSANINFIGGHIDGSLIGQSLAGTGESHYFPFSGNIDPVPEPATLSLAALGAGLFGAITVARRRKAA